MHCCLFLFLSSATKPPYLQPSNSTGYLHSTRKQELSHRTQASSAGESLMYIAVNYIQVTSWNQNARIKSKQTNKQTAKLTAAPPPASLFLHAGFVFPHRKIGK